jgi:hypothetical protein
LTAALPGERAPASISVYLPPSDTERVVVLQPLDLRRPVERVAPTQPAP